VISTAFLYTFKSDFYKVWSSPFIGKETPISRPKERENVKEFSAHVL